MTYRRAADGSPAVHIIGYLNSERKGAAGIEAAYNALLEKTGARVSAFYSSDALNRSFAGEPVRTVDSGYSDKTGLSLTLDWGLQQKLEQIADGHLSKGAIIIAGAETGEILASVSRPVYSLDNLAHYINSTDGEFINRAFAAFTPGSVFKTVVAAAALEIDPDYLDFTHDCTGIIDVSGRSFRCHRRWGHGELCMTGAYAESCNTYFISLALDMGYPEIYSMAKNLGVGEFGLLDGLSVSRGNIPDLSGAPPALIANTAIGQGELLITPLEAARIFCAVANGGVMPELSLVKSLTLGNAATDVRNIQSRRVFSERTVSHLADMARAVVESGTGVLAAPEHGAAAGKTSSAESGQLAYVENEDGELIREQIVHSWFAGYYPAEPERKPLYSITVIAEGGVNQNVSSAAIFKEICDYLGGLIY
jgi:cell division protein FtsI/penicillin-binding protein 2